MKIIKNYFYNAIYQLFKIFIPLITIPYLSRVLGPKGIGINSYTYAIVQYFVFLSDLGITVYGNRRIAYVRDNKYKLTQNFYEIMIVQIFTVIFAYFSFFIFLNFTDSFYRPYYLAQSILIISMAFDISWFFMGVENFKITVFRNFVVRIIILICIFIFVKNSHDLIVYIILFSSSFLIGNITLFVSLHKYIGLPKIHNLHIWRHFWPAFLLFIPQIAGQIYGLLNKNILGILTSSKEVGYFDQADKVNSLLLAIVTATGTVMLPHVSHAFAKGKLNMTRKYLYNSFSIVTALSVPIAFGVITISNKFVILFFSSKFKEVIPLMSIESIAIILIAWSNVIGIQYLLPTKQTKSFTVSIILGSIINITIDMPFIHFWGVIGSMIAWIITELAVTSYQLFIIRYQINYKILFKDLYKYILSGIFMCVIVSFLDAITSISWISLIIETIVGICSYTILIFILHANVWSIIKRMSHNKV